MKAKTVKAVLRKKVGEWIASIEDQKLRDLVLENTIVTGGAIASMLLGEKVNDYDIYFKTKECTLAVAQYYLKKFKPNLKKGTKSLMTVQDNDGRIKIIIKSEGIASEEGSKKAYEYFEGSPDQNAGDFVGEVMQDPGDIEEIYEETKELAKSVEDLPKYRPVFISTNAITLSNQIQIVLRFYGEPEEIHENYDFIHCTNYWTAKNSELFLNQPALESLLARELRYSGSLYPLASMIRMRKFIQRKWSINAGQILKMALQISDLDLRDIAVLEEQLTGVDVAYFLQLIEILKGVDKTKLDYAYIVEIIDRMF